MGRTREKPSPAPGNVQTLVLCLATEALEADIWTNKQHLMTRLSQRAGYFVIYVDQGMSTREIRKALRSRNWRYFIHPVRMAGENLLNVSPWFLPLIKGGALKRIGWRLLGWYLRRRVSKIQRVKTVLWIYQPQAFYLLAHLELPEMVRLYDCVDDFKTQPFYNRHPKRRLELENIETALLRELDAVIATSPDLYEKKRKQHSNVHLIHNVGDFEHFNHPPEIDSHRYLDPLVHPAVMYAGVVDDYKLDLDLIDQLAVGLPDFHFYYIGPVRVKQKQALFSRLRQHTNVHFPGYVPYQDLPALLHQAEILLFPYALNEHTRHVFPIKLFEGLATGRYIVAKQLPSYREYYSYFATFNTPDEAKAQIAAYGKDTGRDERIRVARQNNWDARLQKILNVIDQHQEKGL